FEAPLPASRLQELALKLGADVPMCLLGTTLRATGIGEDIVPVDVASMAIILVNPGMPVSTPAVFTALEAKRNPSLTQLPSTNDQTTWIEWLRAQRNDLQTSALASVPNISACLQALEEKPGYLLGRMSGSGATCFGLFDDDQSALKAVSSIRNANPDWWVRAGRTI
ncbi:MAG: 4-(cytidine 5'-diphospho)-2-C-methyl-D-erythritol kinase, partial [Pseudomonadota bacterium]